MLVPVSDFLGSSGFFLQSEKFSYLGQLESINSLKVCMFVCVCPAIDLFIPCLTLVPAQGRYTGYLRKDSYSSSFVFQWCYTLQDLPLFIPLWKHFN